MSNFNSFFFIFILFSFINCLEENNENVPDIKINNEIIDVYIGIIKLVENIAEGETLIAYETNVTDISNIKTTFDLAKFDFQDEGGSKRCECLFRKYDKTPLYVVCYVNIEGISWLSEIKEEKIYYNIDNKYNFRFQPVKNEEKIYYTKNSKGAFIYASSPEIFNFAENDIEYVYYSSEGLNYIKGITFNGTDELYCTISNNKKRCAVPKAHFQGKENGYYFTQHTNHLGNKSTNYEIAPVKVIVEYP